MAGAGAAPTHLAGSDRGAMLIQKRDPVCCIYEKLALSGSGQLRIGKDIRNEICYDVQNCVSGEHAILEWRDGIGVPA